MQNADFTEKKQNIIKHEKFYMGNEILTFRNIEIEKK